MTQEAISKSPERVADKDVNENGKTSDEWCKHGEGTNPLSSGGSLNGGK